MENITRNLTISPTLAQQYPTATYFLKNGLHSSTAFILELLEFEFSRIGFVPESKIDLQVAIRLLKNSPTMSMPIINPSNQVTPVLSPISIKTKKKNKKNGSNKTTKAPVKKEVSNIPEPTPVTEPDSIPAEEPAEKEERKLGVFGQAIGIDLGDFDIYTDEE